jgi:glycosyltransferase involved in cell wall biosynthesis
VNTPRVSVIIPHLNQPDFLLRCLQSVASQSYDQSLVDVIVVDNGSRKQPAEICNQFPNVKLLSEVTPGPGPARNKGIEAAKTDVLAFIDADCIADPNWLMALTTALQNSGTDIVGGDVRIAYEDSKNLTALEAYESVFAYRQKEYIEKKHFSGTGNLATTKKVMHEVGSFRGIEVAEDRDWGNRATMLGKKISYFPGMIVSHPARKTFEELIRKWDRHTSHDYEETSQNWAGKLKWFLRSIMVAASSVIDGYKIFQSNRLGNLQSRLKAFTILFRIRLYRASHMFALLLNKNSNKNSQKWNRN